MKSSTIQPWRPRQHFPNQRRPSSSAVFTRLWRSGQVGMERLVSALTLKMDLQSYNLHSSLDSGHPSDEHVVQHQPPNPPVSDHGQWHHHHRRQKGPARQRKDQARARKHQAGLQPNKSADSADILLPFRGEILPFNQDDETASVPGASCQTSSSALSRKSWTVPPVTTPTGAGSGPHSISKPMKPKTPLSSSRYVDYNVVKKNLFSPKPAHVPPRLQDPPSAQAKKKCKMREDDLWKKIFNSVN